ncbi:MAG TPA: pilus assembly protein TadG-related protein [Solirubrobacteraceae bacterium]|nr:pilus assembly protein TadG-related protein [Solirubrobacteraceae bacterium]
MRLRSRLGEESGAILVITAVMLIVIIGFAALAIDVGSFYQAQRQAQGAADAGALAGADALAASGAAAASATASATATANDPGATPTVVVSGSQVTVSMAASAPTYFGKILHPGNFPIQTRAVAGISQSAIPCTGSGGNCYVVFAKDSNCSDNGFTLSGGNWTLDGGIHSNSGIRINGGNNHFGPTSYGPTQSGCAMKVSGGNNHFGSETSEAPITDWPIDYTNLYPACTGSQCTGPDGTPPYCTHAAPNFSFTSSPQDGIYCAYGDAADHGDPAQYTGQVAVSGGNERANVTFVCGNLTVSGGNLNFNPYNSPTNKLLVYAAAPGGVAISGGNLSLNGDVFAPTGTIAMSGGNASTNFLEGNTVTLSGGNIKISGDGPVVGGSQSSSTASLLQ